MSLNELLIKALPLVKDNVEALQEPMPLYTIFISICDGKNRAIVVNASANAFTKAWGKAIFKCRRKAEKDELQPEWLRVDWVRSAEKLSWEELEDRLKKVKRNYFRYGLALDGGFHKVFLEQEINANAMLYGGNKIPYAIVNKKNFEIYARKRYKDYVPDFSDDVYVLDTQGVFCSIEESPRQLFPAGKNAGRRMELMDQQAVYSLIQRSSHYLSTQVQSSGQFHYGWHPCFDRPINAYNTLRHASTTYSMLEAWEVTRDETLKASIDRSLNYLTGTLIQNASLDNGDEAAFLVDQGGEVKLGGNAVCLLALAKYTELTGDEIYLGLIERLALGIRFMQDPDTGAFIHVLNYPDLSIKEKFRIIYYEGEAAFGLMRAYGLTKDTRWIEIVEKAFNHFIANDTWKAHDHWLSYCVNELTRYRPEEKYYRFGIQNVAGYLDFVMNRITTFPTLLELMMAAEKMICRIQENDANRHLLDQLDLDKFYRALEARAEYLLNGHFWPEYAMYFKNPERILGSFYIRHHSFRVRIDDVEHYLSGFVAYLGFLKKSRKPELSSEELPISSS